MLPQILDALLRLSEPNPVVFPIDVDNAEQTAMSIESNNGIMNKAWGKSFVRVWGLLIALGLP
jgi:hypothetical protein